MSGKELLEKALNDENWKIKQIQECLELLSEERERSLYLKLLKKLFILEDQELLITFIKKYKIPMCAYDDQYMNEITTLLGGHGSDLFNLLFRI